MNLFSKKSTFLIGSILGSAIGLLFAREGGKNIRAKMKTARTPQKKFEALFQEYLKVGKAAVAEARESELMGELIEGGKEILAELKKKADAEGGSAVKFAHKKASEVLRAVEKQANGIKKKTAKKVVRAKKSVLKKNPRARKVVQKLEAAKKKIGRKITPKKVTKKKEGSRKKKSDKKSFSQKII